MKTIFTILTALIILSCSESPNDFTQNPTDNNKLDITIPSGKWLITNSFAVNGPICIFIDVGDTVLFEPDMDNDFYLHYASGPEDFSDFFMSRIDDNKIFGEGLYKAFVYNDAGHFVDTTLPQTIEILYLDKNNIQMIIKHGIEDPQTKEIRYGEVTDVYASRVEKDL